ncbi:MAG: hypothetical protein IKK70_03600 [Clostridia bacterium]|nr:hypothetical protein [Clostridia bacterium]
MKKRIFALLTALLVILSMAVFAGCDKKDDGDDNDDSVKELTAKEQFAASLENGIGGTLGEAESILGGGFANGSDTAGSFKLSIDKLEAEGIDLTSLGTIAMSGEFKFDNDSFRESIDLSLELFGDKPSLGMVVDTDNIFFTDLLGLNDSPIRMPLDDYYNEADAEMLAQIEELYAAADEVIEKIINAGKNAINSNINDSAYTSEIKTVTYGGIEIKDATVLTLTIDKEKASNIVNDFIKDLVNIEELKGLIGNEINVDDALEAMSGLGEIRISTIVKDDKLAGITVIVTEDDEDSAESIAAYFVTTDNSFSFEMGLIDENGAFVEEEGIFECKYAYDVEAGTEKFNMSFIEDGYTENFVLLDATVADGVHTGTLSIAPDENESVSIDYSYEATANGCKLNITEIEVPGTTLPLNLAIEYAVEETKITASMTLDISINGMVDLSASMEYVVETADVTIDEVTDYIEMDDFDVTNIEEDLKDLYPKLFMLFSNMEI